MHAPGSRRVLEPRFLLLRLEVKCLEHLHVYDPSLPVGERMTGKTAVVVNRREKRRDTSLSFSYDFI